MIRELALSEFDGAVDSLAAILVDAVDSGAGVSFLKPLSPAAAAAYWRGLKPALGSGAASLFVAERAGDIAGTVQLHKAWPPNQPHRGEVAKLLVHRRHRAQGLGAALMRALEAKARSLGLTLLTFDAVAHGPVERFYRGLGYTCIGYIPGYALSGDGGLDDTAILYKQF